MSEAEIQMQNKIYQGESEMKTDKPPFNNRRFHMEPYYLLMFIRGT